MVALMHTDVHLQRRRSWTRGMSPAALKGYEEIVARRARLLVKRLEDQGGRAVVLGEWMNFFSCVLISTFSFILSTPFLRVPKLLAICYMLTVPLQI